jgi:hypothetical protein
VKQPHLAESKGEQDPVQTRVCWVLRGWCQDEQIQPNRDCQPIENKHFRHRRVHTSINNYIPCLTHDKTVYTDVLRKTVHFVRSTGGWDASSIAASRCPPRNPVTGYETWYIQVYTGIYQYIQYSSILYRLILCYCIWWYRMLVLSTWWYRMLVLRHSFVYQGLYWNASMISFLLTDNFLQQDLSGNTGGEWF